MVEVGPPTKSNRGAPNETVTPLVGLGWVHKLMGWVGLFEEKWTHVHFCVIPTKRRSYRDRAWTL